MVCPIPFPESESSDFWPAYQEWQHAATEEELRQLEVALEALQSNEVMPLPKALQLALCDSQVQSRLPPALVQRLRGLQWPVVQAVA
jgi:hypothetical protein